MVCDFQAVYRIRIDPDRADFAGLTGPQFLRYASRLPGYPGVMRLRAANLSSDAPTPAATPQPVRDGTPLVLTTDALLSQFVEYSTAPPADP